MRRVILVAACAALIVIIPSTTFASECDDPQPEWLACEDFEGGSQGWDTWFAESPWVECLGCRDGNTENPDRIMLDDSEARDGSWSLFMPATAAANYRGASLTWRSCQGEKRQGCMLENYETLYYRAWVKLAPDHQYVHHFMSIAGTQPDQYWGADGNAGCRPNGERAAGSTVDFNEDHELFFYTYSPDMNCDSGGYCSGDYAQNICDGCATKDMPCSNGLECCWGNHYSTDPRPVLERDRWVCLEMMMSINTPGQSDGVMAFWIDDELGHQQDGMYWRDVPELGLNKVWAQHYIAGGDADQSNRIWWDDIVISTQRIGCAAPPQNNGTATNNAGDTNNDDGVVNNSNGSGGNPDDTPDPDDPINDSSNDDTPSNDQTISGEGGGCAIPGFGATWLALLLGFVGLTRRKR